MTKTGHWSTGVDDLINEQDNNYRLEKIVTTSVPKYLKFRVVQLLNSLTCQILCLEGHKSIAFCFTGFFALHYPNLYKFNQFRKKYMKKGKEKE